MGTETYVRTRIDPAIKQEAIDVLADIGIKMSDFLRIAVTMVAEEKALPFEIKQIPNRVTVEAMNEARSSMSARFNDVDDLIHDIEKDCGK
ncbi:MULTISPECIES: type II toxin-antitoxin system RelB/DinJ family antitoxin [unclassified Photorhabdus]|uniref:type II toxin-antitoxin system RelB/DinJ family antitoxin n=1 Tax=unclassified Photorhabdus TaxID=2620880 RepID=UPI000DCBC26E|nr:MULTISPECIES: type II toxin-antitoxin system RelB/DinJ family antitoxin [unclassified Photorhabdus]RAW94203.1 type II toxin-antitoxin system antitoxin, RelB/DinJ family [Photorhabdus sp. S9-53]RAW94349.1 type II toxin-antitoxin system antitoxin, RelB/DinJ family [Photorhabdus sp. S10-54]RAW98034.1 type II toxin-antitoxin system antitoxin, RelB/DinJ family [Photorhabdus sp. S8-52]